MTIPNLLTSLRILLLPFILFFLFVESNYFVAGILFIISSLTDLFDGYIARKFDQVSQLGKLLDPLADKLTVISIFTVLTLRGVLPFWILIVVLGREGVILLGSVFVFFEDKEVIKPSNLGKAATFLLYVTAGAYILEIEFLQYAVYAAIPLALISGAKYCINSYNYFFRDKSWQG